MGKEGDNNGDDEICIKLKVLLYYLSLWVHIKFYMSRNTRSSE